MADKTRRTPTERAQAALDKVNAELAEIGRMHLAARARIAELITRAELLEVQRDYLAANPALAASNAPLPRTRVHLNDEDVRQADPADDDVLDAIKRDPART